MNQEHGPFEFKRFNRVANTDLAKEKLGEMNEGEHLGLRNMRPSSVTGHKGDPENIHGEVVIYPKNFAFGDYEDIGAVKVNNHIVEFWADRNGIEDSLIRIDGQIVLKSFKFPIQVAFPLQIDKDENCHGGEVYITDFNVAPMLFNVQDLIDASDPTSPNYDPNKYFGSFNLNLYTTSLKWELDRPAFINLENLGGGGGVPPGTYAYSYRYGSASGDRTKFGYETPLIPVVETTGSNSSQYPYIKTYGAASSPTSNTSYGVKLKLRINNVYNYEYIEIRRIAYNQGAGLGFLPQPYIIARIPITAGEVSVREFVDGRDDDPDPIPITDNEDTQFLSEIEAAKTLRYFNRRLTFMNIRYASRNIDGVQLITDGNGSAGFPIIEKLGKSGHDDPYNFAYYRSRMHGERTGWGLLCMDGNGEVSFVREFTQAEMADIYEMPNRRDPLSADTLAYSVTAGKGAATAADVNNNTNYTHEVFDLTAAIQKNDNSTPKNISAHGSKGITTASSIGYKPLRPVSGSDPDVTGHNFLVNTRAYQDGSTSAPYAPQGFGPNYYAQGAAIRGVNVGSLPSWVKSFAVVQTPPAGRIVCQGIGVYRMTEADRTLIGVGFSSGITKDKNRLVFFSSDIDRGIVSSDVINDINANPGRYTIQVVSPLGYFSEVYGGEIQALGFDKGVDLVSYARVLYNDGTINPGIAPSGNFYTKFGSWRNTLNGGNTLVANGGNHQIAITGFQSVSEGRETYYELSLAEDIYDNSSQGGGGGTINGWEFDDLEQFHEPFYIINIIQDGKQVKSGNINEYMSTGQYQKLKSVIGISDGSVGQSFELVDERFDDCIPNRFDPNVANINTYLFTVDANDNEQVWLNVTYKTAADITTILNALNTAGFYNDGTYNIVGVYTSTNVNDRFYTIEFDHFNTAYPANLFAPAQGLKIVVKYDTRFPIRVFGGDVTIGEDVFALIDRNSGPTGNKDNEFLMASGFPYRKYEFNSNYWILRTGDGAINKIQSQDEIKLDYIRQLLIMFTAESRTVLPYYYGEYFPMVHYVMRPYTFDGGNQNANFDSGGGNVYDDYLTDYPNEFNSWGYGGFKFFGEGNIDYSAILNDRSYTSKPKVGFKEINEFCTRSHWSNKREINVQDSPGLRTFPASNTFDISDEQGDIKYAFDATSSKGSNLYAFCNTGICLLITEKSILSDLNAGQLGYMAADGFIMGEYWLNKEIGMWDEMWRTASEASVPFGEPGGAISRMEALHWANNESVFRFVDNSVYDIGRIKFYSTIYNELLKNIGPGYSTHITAGYDRLHEEYWLSANTCKRRRKWNIEINGKRQVSLNKDENDTSNGRFMVFNGASVQLTDVDTVELDIPLAGSFSITLRNNNARNMIALPGRNLGAGEEITVIAGPKSWVYTAVTASPQEEVNVTCLKKTYVFGENPEHKGWYGYYDYAFDRFVSLGTRIFGMRDLTTYELDKGFIINGAIITCHADQAYSPPGKSRRGVEFERIHVNSNVKPIKIEFRDDPNGPVLCVLDQATKGPLYLKDYDGWEQGIPRKDASVSPKRDRVQGRLLIYRVIHNLAQDFRITDVGIQIKQLK